MLGEEKHQKPLDQHPDKMDQVLPKGRKNREGGYQTERNRRLTWGVAENGKRRRCRKESVSRRIMKKGRAPPIKLKENWGGARGQKTHFATKERKKSLAKGTAKKRGLEEKRRRRSDKKGPFGKKFRRSS